MKRLSKKTKKNILLSLLAVVILFAGYIAYSIYQILHPQTLFQTAAIVQPTPEVVTPAVTQDIYSPSVQSTEEEVVDSRKEFENDRVNILMLGLDAAPERMETMRSFRADVIMLVSVDFKSNEVFLISIPRDSYTEIPGVEGRYRINESFSKGGSFKGDGFSKTLETVTHFFGGVPIQYYVGVDMQAFKKLVDLIGGIEYEVETPVDMNGRHLDAGLQLLSGQQVLDYVRNRTGSNDIKRVSKQQEILMAALEQMKSKATITKIPQMYLSVADDIYTSLGLKQIAGLAYFASKLSIEDIHRYTVAGEILIKDGHWFWGVDQEKKKELVKDVFGVEIDVDFEEDVKYLLQKEAEKTQQPEATQ